MSQPSILISGAGIAGPAAAYWLARAGYSPTVVEVARELRTGGQAVDFRGPVHRAVLQKMALWEPIHAHQTHQRTHTMLGADGKPVAAMPAMMLSGDVEILRGDLSRLLYDRSRADTNYRFGDSIAALKDDASGVEVRFASGRKERFDLVIGADGLHSRVRGLVFGDETTALRQYGFLIAGFSMPNVLGLEHCGVTYSRVDRGVSVSSINANRARVLFCFRSPTLDVRRLDAPARLELVEAAFAEAGWEVPNILAGLHQANDLYFDSIATVHLPRYTAGRVALLGDAAWGGTLGGQGTPLAIIGAYVLAGELAVSPDDHAAAFARYQKRMRPYAIRCQGGAKHVGGFYAPPSRLAMGVRNSYLWLFAQPWFADFFERIVTGAAKDFELPEYDFGATRPLPEEVLQSAQQGLAHFRDAQAAR